LRRGDGRRDKSVGIRTLQSLGESGGEKRKRGMEIKKRSRNGAAYWKRTEGFVYLVAIFCHRRPTRATPREGRRTEKGQRGISRKSTMGWKGYGWMRAESLSSQNN